MVLWNYLISVSTQTSIKSTVYRSIGLILRSWTDIRRARSDCFDGKIQNPSSETKKRDLRRVVIVMRKKLGNFDSTRGGHCRREKPEFARKANQNQVKSLRCLWWGILHFRVIHVVQFREIFGANPSKERPSTALKRFLSSLNVMSA